MTGTDFFASLASGSKANCYVISIAGSVILIDAGLSYKKTKLRLSNLGIDPEMIDAVIITHEHCDHTAGLLTLVKNIDAPVYMTQGSYFAFIRGRGFELRNRITPIAGYGEMAIKENVTADFRSVPHDSADCVALKLRSGNFCLGICTDTAVPPPPEFFAGCSVVALESNYDVHMLAEGSYPEALKHRIRSGCGHMSNESAAKYAAELEKNGCRGIVLCHLSLENNTPEIALKTVKEQCALEVTCAAPDEITFCGSITKSISQNAPERLLVC